MSLARAFILVIGDDGVLLLPPLDARHAAPIFLPEDDDSAFERVAKALRERPQTPVLLLADTLAQEYRREAVPRLGFFDRRKLLTRRMLQYFPPPPSPHTQLTNVLPLRANTALFACLHDGEPAGVWLKQIASLPNPLVGTALLPLESALMIPRLMPAAAREWALMLTYNRVSGFRQIVTRDGELIFTRLTPPPAGVSSPRFIASTIMLDVQATLDYLARQGLTDSSQLHFAALLPEGLHEALIEQALPFRTCRVWTPHQAAIRLQLAFAPTFDDPASDTLHAAWLCRRRKPRVVLLSDDKRQARQTATIKRIGKTAAIAGFFSTFVLTLSLGADLPQLALANRAIQKENTALEEQLTRERAALAPVTEPLGQLRQALAWQRLFAAPAPSPWTLLQKINLSTGTTARALRFEWSRREMETLSLTLRLTDKTTPATEAERQNIVQRFEELAKTLRAALPAYTVEVTRYPFSFRPQETLTNNVGDSVPSADFIFRETAP